MIEIVWLNTVPKPGTENTRGQRGWKFHAVRGNEKETFEAVKYRRSLCGLLPMYGWHIDLYMNENARCERCVKKVAERL